jgi:hypothetical protein
MNIDTSVRYSLRLWLVEHQRQLVRLLVIGVVLIATAYLARDASVLYLGLFIGLGVVLILVRRPLLGLVGVIVGALVIPFGVGTGSESELNPPLLLLILLMVAWLLDMLRRQEIRLMSSRTFRPLIAFLVVALLSFGVGQLPWFYTSAAPMRAQIGGLLIFILSAGAFLLTCHYVKDVRWLKQLTWLFLSLGGFYILGRIVPQVGNITGKLFPNGASGSLFWTWLVALAFSQAIYNRHLRPIWRFVLLALAIVTMFLALYIAEGWTSGWGPPLVAVIVILLVGSPRVGIGVSAIAAILAFLMPNGILSLLNAGDNAYSAMTRVAAWNTLYEIIKVSPFIGFGPANYYFYTPLFSILGYHVRFNSHNNYVDLVAQTGLLGLCCFIWFCWEVGRTGWKLRSRAPEGFAQAYVYGALGGLAGTLVAGMLGDWVLPFVYNIGFAGFRSSVLGWIFLGGLVAIELMLQPAGQTQKHQPKTVKFMEPVISPVK